MSFDSYETDEQDDPATLTDDRRTTPRFCARAIATIYRDCDTMRKGIPVKLHNISVAGLGLTVEDAELELLEQVKVRLQNDVQRFDREVRGIVRHISALNDGTFRLGIELTSRLTPLEVSLLKVRPLTGENDGNSTWV
jgi:PilZ domain